MLDQLKQLIDEVDAFQASSLEDVEAFRIKYLGSKGPVERTLRAV